MKKRLFFIKNLKTILPFIFVFSLVSISIPFYYTYYECLSRIKNQFNKQQIAVAKQTGLGIKENIKLAVRELKNLSKNPSVTNFELNECKKIFEMKMQFYNSLYINDIGIIDSDGILRTNMTETGVVGKDLSSREYFKKAKKLKKSVLIFEFIRFLGVDTDEKGIIITMPFFHSNNTLKGMVVFIIKIRELIKAFIPLDDPIKKYCVIDAQGTALCDPYKIIPRAPSKNNLSEYSFADFLEKAKDGQTGTYEYNTPSGSKTIAVIYQIKIENQTWPMIITLPEEELLELLKPFYTKFLVAALIVIVLGITTTCLIVYLFNILNNDLDLLVKSRTKELFISEDKLKSTVETINEFIWEIDTDYRYTYVSPLSKQLLGYDPQELMEKTIFDFMQGEDAIRFKSTLQQIGKNKKPFNNLERPTFHKNGNLVIFETNGLPILDERGILLGFRGADRDVTQRKKVEIELRKHSDALEDVRVNLERKVAERTAELEKVHRMLLQKETFAAIGELASGISHELRNPLGVIKNAIYFFNMKKDSFEDETIKENIDIIYREINIADSIIKGLLDFTRTRSPVPLDIEINHLVSEMLSKSIIPDNIEVITDFAKGLPLVSADPTQVAQLFLNLTENAVHAMETGGRLNVSTKINSGFCNVCFEDNGCGIDQKDLDRIFEPLFTTKTKGIGLGLSISKSIAEANAIDLSVTSRKGKGTTFTVSFKNTIFPKFDFLGNEILI